MFLIILFIKRLLLLEYILPKLEEKRNLKKAELLKKKENQNKFNKEIQTMVSHQLKIEEAHPRQEKPKYFGEVIEMDGSIHKWFGSRRFVYI